MTQHEMSFPQENRPVDDKFLKIKHAIDSSDTVQQLHTALQLKDLWLLRKQKEADAQSLKESFDRKAAELGYWDWRNSY